jgi:hypothetical protein
MSLKLANVFLRPSPSDSRRDGRRWQSQKAAKTDARQSTQVTREARSERDGHQHKAASLF